MDEDQLNDLKQFMAATVSQATAGMVTKDDLDRGLTTLRTEMNQRFDEVQSAIAETITNSNDNADDQLKDHEQRIIKLEQRRA